LSILACPSTNESTYTSGGYDCGKVGQRSETKGVIDDQTYDQTEDRDNETDCDSVQSSRKPDLSSYPDRRPKGEEKAWHHPP
jgi:hypothetical protein